MTEARLYNASRALAVGLMVISAMIAAAVQTPDTGLTRQTIAWLTVGQAGITIAVGFLPRAQGDGQKRAG